jgi:transposase
MERIEGTRAAFEAMLSERGVYKKLGVDRSTVAGWKRRLQEGENLSLDKMEEMLEKYGAKVVKEKVWGMP